MRQSTASFLSLRALLSLLILFWLPSQSVSGDTSITSVSLQKNSCAELIKFFDHPDLQIRHDALVEITNRGVPAVKPLTASFHNPSAQISHEAARALVRLAPIADSALPIMTQSITAKDPFIREAATAFLVRSGKRALMQIFPLLRSPQKEISDKAAAIIEEILWYLSDEGFSDLIFAYKKLEKTEIHNALMILTNHQDLAVRQAAISVLSGHFVLESDVLVPNLLEIIKESQGYATPDDMPYEEKYFYVDCVHFLEELRPGGRGIESTLNEFSHSGHEFSEWAAKVIRYGLGIPQKNKENLLEGLSQSFAQGKCDRDSAWRYFDYSPPTDAAAIPLLAQIIKSASPQRNPSLGTGVKAIDVIANMSIAKKARKNLLIDILKNQKISRHLHAQAAMALGQVGIYDSDVGGALEAGFRSADPIIRGDSAATFWEFGKLDTDEAITCLKNSLNAKNRYADSLRERLVTGLGEKLALESKDGISLLVACLDEDVSYWIASKAAAQLKKLSKNSS